MNKDAISGQAVYSKPVLSIYDIWVLGFSNHFLWKCPTKLISKQFADLATNNHLDVGVGTGYYLKKNLHSQEQRIALMDLNENSLLAASSVIPHLTPEVYCKNVLEPLEMNCEKFDSVSLNYLLHCLPGSISEKSIVFSYLKELMNPNATIFGSTILGKGTNKNFLAEKIQSIYNSKGIFSNEEDDVLSLREALEHHFANVNIKVIGSVALFYANNH
ncbi:class I SAM-dependent methyltransferase [Plesiomonas shigelloides]|uniref:class I SAM-dependent methyltransferase n=1 Tax=Plesiomonas shigelloides TaxID=703 RepID=UPI001262AAE9|nr:class I SAM-dependent methyltransferase [Plesiomonas shigelloides]KAB7661862.1 methyltransferase domain-containing protein [Plesiomonas shigelloides]